MSPDQTSELRDEALRKVGRNVVNFQKIEGMLKLLISRREFRGHASELKSKFEEQRQAVEFDTLGKLAKEYFESVYCDCEPETEWSSLGRAHVGISFRIIAEEGSLQAQKEDFKNMVFERNRLIHQMLTHFNPNSIDSCRSLIAELDKQHETILRHYKNLQNELFAFQAAMNQLARNIREGSC